MKFAKAPFAYAMLAQSRKDKAKSEAFKNIMTDGCNSPAFASLSTILAHQYLMTQMEVRCNPQDARSL